VLTLEDGYPNIARYMNKLAQDPAVRFALQVEKTGDAPGGEGYRGHLSITQLDMSKPSFTSTLAAA
jgi:glutathione S-transferase